MTHSDPIVAIATAQGRGAVGIVRVSGKNLRPWAEQWLGRPLRPREATYLPFHDAHGVPIDHGLALFFPAPHSFTGEDVLELQAHGGAVVLQLLLARCLEAASPQLPFMRLARPGEFSERAFLNGKIDLAQAEAIADLIDASTEAAARSAAQSLSGVFSREVNTLKDALIHLRMLVEAHLDFPEEEIDFVEESDALAQLTRIQNQLTALMQRATQGALLRDGISLVIAGQPNVGKSSLLNALAGAELAIVTPIPGTTRDKVQQTIQIEGIPVHVIDTAGLRQSDDEVEQIGIARTWDAIGRADAVLFLHDLTRRGQADYQADDASIAREIAEKIAASVPLMNVWNKADSCDVPLDIETDAHMGIAISAKTGAGLETLRRSVLETVGWQASGEGLFIARERHLQLLRTVNQHLDAAAAHFTAPFVVLELLAEELRLAQNALSEITGAFTPDDLLGVIFTQFCIGK
jgi:tRNA modification GTPase